MTANAGNTKPAPSRLPTLEDVESGKVSLDDYEIAHHEDIPELTDADFARARPTSDFPELAAAFERARQQPRPPELPVDVSAPVAVNFDSKTLRIRLADNRNLVVPLTWYPDLVEATDAQREAYVLTPEAIRWPELGEEASIADILRAQLKIAALQDAATKHAGK